jgi:hypothetical protein
MAAQLMLLATLVLMIFSVTASRFINSLWVGMKNKKGSVGFGP